MKIDIYVPQLIRVRDYHEFDEIEEVLKKLNKNFHVIELGGSYIGLIYFNKIPKKKEQIELVQKFFGIKSEKAKYFIENGEFEYEE